MSPEKDARKVVFFSDAPYTGGAEKYLHLLASGLDRSRYEPSVVICRAEKLKRFREWLERDGIPVHEIEWEGVFSIRGARSFARIVRELSPQIVHLNLPGPFDSKYGLAAPVARRAGAVGVIATEHLPMIGSFRKARILRGISGRFIDRVITVSVDNRNHLVGEHHVHPDKIRVVYNGIPDLRGPTGAIRRSEKAGSARGMEIVMVGALEERKGHRLMIDAMTDLPDDVFLSIIGEGELAASLAEFAARRKVAGRVRFSGYRDDVASILSEADLLVLPTALDAAPYVVLEALSSGLPVVASGIYGLPELIMDGRTGILTAPGDREDLLKAVRRMYAEPGLRARMSESCRRDYLERFTIGKSVLATMAVYDELFRNGRAPGEMK